jgi:hypothetical protein
MQLKYRDKFLPAKGSDTHKIANRLNYKTLALIATVFGLSQLQMNVSINYPSFEILIYRFAYITLALEIGWTVYMNFMNSFQETVIYRSVRFKTLSTSLPNTASIMLDDYTYAISEIKRFWVKFGNFIAYCTIVLYVLVPVAIIKEQLIAEVASLLAFATIRKLQVMRSLDIVRHNETIIMAEVSLSQK